MNDYLSVEELAARLKISKRTIHELTRKNEIPFYRSPKGRRCLFVPDEVDRWLEYHADHRMGAQK